ncbi:MAG TPA: hypothetical protein VJT14_02090 [Candidatus Dormibacteraeota bacterium]|nr:hypothetical protein [Candidatus Dormibacteraeota bacterium]
MNEQDGPPADSTPTPTPSDRTGWSQPPAPQSPGPPGAFTDRPAAPPGAPLPPGAGSPVQPGPPLSVQAPIKDTTINMGALLLGVGAVVLVIIVVVIILIAVFSHH